jgi:hypothetical protein
MQPSRGARPGVIIAAGWLILVVYAYPGQMTAQSFEVLRQARGKFFAPENPPALSAMWRWLELLLAGPSSMLLVQSAAFAIGAYAILRRAMPERPAAWVTAGLLVFPPVMVPLAVIWPDSMMTGLLVLGAAGLLSDHTRRNYLGLLALLLATLAQPHALVATLPIVLMLFRPRAGTTEPRRIAIAGVTWLAIALAGLGATKHYTKKPYPPLAGYVTPRADHEWVAVPLRELPPDAMKLGVPIRTTAIQDTSTSVLASIAAHTPLFSPWLYLALALGLIPFALRQPDVLALLVGGVLSFVTYRNPVWLVASACVSLAMVLARLRTRRRSP